MSNIFDYTLIYATIRSATPILFAALCATITQQADILNIGTEGIMLTSAFVAVLTSFVTGSWLVAIVAAIISGIAIAMIMAVANIKYNAHICAVGIAVNMFALAITKFGIKQFLGTSGTFTSPEIVPIPRIHITALEQNAVLNGIFNNWCVTEVFGIIMVGVLWFLLFRTVWGLRVRCVGRLPMAAETAGINVRNLKYQVMIISGIMGGLAGAHLSLGYSQMFAENITNGRGFMGVAAMNFGAMNPILVWMGTLIFGFIDSVGARLQSYGLPSQFILMLPYVFTITVLVLAMWRKGIKDEKAKSSL
ncbi:ABC transporter permease [Enterocloster sp. OA13]|uniref:ABC transporter permease n=1 Tax=Enterocloster TaxID=2719313 RepID=UPI001D130077|nr:ABC transporter permease [Lachnoclostridium pacaense]MCC2820627.1 ABC transporter permease [Lachnoclostridium pacaense]MCC2876176.1 ABC transporter permease [Lachnoclostridium pacaense]MCD8169978.1 ABC transporter permease [Clostridiales bacterium]MCH1947591.1 ABC transporter permease [Enterocloster sp. OA13]